MRSQARVPAGVRTGGQWSSTARPETPVELAASAGAAGLAEVTEHLDAAWATSATLMPLLAQAEIAGPPQRREALRARLDATPVGLAMLAQELDWTARLPAEVAAVGAQRAATLRARLEVALDRVGRGVFLCASTGEPVGHLQGVCVPVVVDDVEQLVVSVVNVQERTEQVRLVVEADRLRDVDGAVARSDVLRIAREHQERA